MFTHCRMNGEYYFKQNYNVSCSAQSVAILYNYLKQRHEINDIDLLCKYPQWRFLIDYTECISGKLIKPGIRLHRLKMAVDQIFGVNSKIVYRPTREQFVTDLGNLMIVNFCRKKGTKLLPDTGHFSPLIGYNGTQVRIGESYTHECKWVDIDNFVERMGATNPDFPGVDEARRGYLVVPVKLGREVCLPRRIDLQVGGLLPP